MKLLVDIGNSRIKWALHEGGQTDRSTSMLYSAGELKERLPEAWLILTRPEKIYIANVAGDEIAEVMSNTCRDLWSVTPDFIYAKNKSSGVTSGYHDISQLGVDRWLSLIAAWHEYRANVCIVGCGTAITIDLVLADGQHIGGYIVPGTHIMQKALTQNTRGIEIETGDATGLEPGRTTFDCVINGSSLAVVALIEKVTAEFRKQYPETTECIITGGGAEALIPLIKTELKYHPDLVLQGISLYLAGDN